MRREVELEEESKSARDLDLSPATTCRVRRTDRRRTGPRFLFQKAVRCSGSRSSSKRKGHRSEQSRHVPSQFKLRCMIIASSTITTPPPHAMLPTLVSKHTTRIAYLRGICRGRARQFSFGSWKARGTHETGRVGGSDSRASVANGLVRDLKRGDGVSWVRRGGRSKSVVLGKSVDQV